MTTVAAENIAFTVSTPVITGTPIGTLTYTLGGADAADFTIDSRSGVISMIARDFEIPEDANVDNDYEVSIIVTDSDGNIDTQTQTVTVTNVNESSVITISAQIHSIEENSANGTNVGAILVTTGNPTGFSITGGNTISQSANITQRP